MGESPYSFDDLSRLVHKDGITLFEYNQMKIPCILLKNETFNELSKAFYGQPLAVDSTLNVLHDNREHVFVEIVLNFSAIEKTQKVILYANDTIEFFECMAQTGIIALAPSSPSGTEANILMVQLPKKEAVEKALELIRIYAKKKDSKI